MSGEINIVIYMGMFDLEIGITTDDPLPIFKKHHTIHIKKRRNPYIFCVLRLFLHKRETKVSGTFVSLYNK